MKRDRYEVAPTPKSAKGKRPWRLTRNRIVLAHGDTQGELVGLGARLANLRLELVGRLAEMVIKRPDGRIRDSRTYGQDPERTRG